MDGRAFRKYDFAYKLLVLGRHGISYLLNDFVVVRLKWIRVSHRLVLLCYTWNSRQSLPGGEESRKREGE